MNHTEAGVCCTVSKGRSNQQASEVTGTWMYFERIPRFIRCDGEIRTPVAKEA